MTPSAKRTYRGFATFFLIGGGVFVVLGALHAAFALDVVQGNPAPVALGLMAIGGLLRWTARDRPDDPDEEEGESGAEGVDAASSGTPDDDAR